MRSAMLTAAALIGLAAGPAFAQSSTTVNPATPSSSQSMPQTANSLPAGSGAQSQPTATGTAVNRGTSNNAAETTAGAAATTKK